MGELALVGDHSTVPLTRVSRNTVFSKSQKTRKARTLCTVTLVKNTVRLIGNIEYLLTLGPVQNGPMPSSVGQASYFFLIFGRKPQSDLEFRTWVCFNFPGLEIMAKANRVL